MTSQSVVQDWLSNLSLKQQTVLLASFRGCDGRVKEDPSKYFTRLMRSILLKNADSSTTFMVQPCEDFNKRMIAFLGDIDSYPMHFLVHFLHAAEIVGYKHPDPEIRLQWLGFYAKGVHALHMYPETEEQLDTRLADNVGGKP